MGFSFRFSQTKRYPNVPIFQTALIRCGLLNFTRYINRSDETRARRFEVEHIWADKFERHTHEFDYEEQFGRFRNRFGGLILLPHGFNQSYGALTYEEKLPHYFGQNLLAQSLNPQCYERNPAFLNLVRQYDLPFRSYEHFDSAELNERQELYRQLCEIIWSPDLLERELML